MWKWNQRENPISPIHLSSLLSYSKSPKPPAVMERLGLAPNPHLPLFFQYELNAVMCQAFCCARWRQWWKRPARTCPRELQSREGGRSISPTCHTPLGLTSYPLSPAFPPASHGCTTMTAQHVSHVPSSLQLLCGMSAGPLGTCTGLIWKNRRVYTLGT